MRPVRSGDGAFDVMSASRMAIFRPTRHAMRLALASTWRQIVNAPGALTGTSCIPPTSSERVFYSVCLVGASTRWKPARRPGYT